MLLSAVEPLGCAGGVCSDPKPVFDVGAGPLSVSSRRALHNTPSPPDRDLASPPLAPPFMTDLVLS
jgi:hypothetical protein